MKKLKIYIYIILLVIPLLIRAIPFVILNGIDEFSFNYFLISIIRVCRVIENSLGFYATCFSMIFAIESFLKQQKDKEEEKDRKNKELHDEIIRSEKEKNEIKLKELEKYKDSFRPNFVQSRFGRKLIVIMKNKDYYIENVKYYTSDDDSGKFYKNLRHNMEIDLKGAKNNYYVTAETLIGEKIIFGVILNTEKVYKVLKEDASPIIPNDFHGESSAIEMKINDNWISFNDFRIKNECGNYKNIDINFMSKTVAIREKMALNTTEHMKEILLIDSVESIFTKVLASISTNKAEFSDDVREKVIRELIEILYENLDKIIINPKNIKHDSWVYINRKINIQSRFKKSKIFAAADIVKEYLEQMHSKNLDDIISIFLELINHADFAKELENNLSIYKNRIITIIEN